MSQKIILWESVLRKLLKKKNLKTREVAHDADNMDVEI
jgi:hypothetical protein